MENCQEVKKKQKKLEYIWRMKTLSSFKMPENTDADEMNLGDLKDVEGGSWRLTPRELRI